VIVCGSVSSCVERALEELTNIQQIVCSQTAIAVLTISGLVYWLSLSADSQVSIRFQMHTCFYMDMIKLFRSGHVSQAEYCMLA